MADTQRIGAIEYEIEVAMPSSEQESAVAKIRQLGGRLTVDETRPERPIFSVGLSNIEIVDAAIADIN